MWIIPLVSWAINHNFFYQASFTTSTTRVQYSVFYLFFLQVKKNSHYSEPDSFLSFNTRLLQNWYQHKLAVKCQIYYNVFVLPILLVLRTIEHYLFYPASFSKSTAKVEYSVFYKRSNYFFVKEISTLFWLPFFHFVCLFKNVLTRKFAIECQM